MAKMFGAREGEVAVDANEFKFDPANAGQVSEWDGPDGRHWAKYHTEYERLLGVFDVPLLDAAVIRPGDRCLDIGCGTGATTRALASRALDGLVFGLDLSGPMLKIARDSAGRMSADMQFVKGDAQVYQFEPASFDVAVSRMGCMFFSDPTAAFANIGRALRSGGRLALAVWQAPELNKWITEIDDAIDETSAEDAATEQSGYAPGPFSLADPTLCASLLQHAGFVDVSIDALKIPLAFGSVDDANAFVQSWVGDDLDEAARARALTSLDQILVEHQSSEGVQFESATWLITARRPGNEPDAPRSSG